VQLQAAVGLLGSQSLAFGGIQVCTQVPLLQPPAKALLQHGVPSALQVLPFGMHIGVVVEVVLVDVEVVGVVVEVLVEVVLADVLVEVLVVVVVLVSQLPKVSPGCCSRWRLAAASPTVIV
jgi:hypothetical protein